MSGDEAELDAVVDSILLRSAGSSSSSAFPPPPAENKSVKSSLRAPTTIHDTAAKDGKAFVDTSIWRQPATAPPTSEVYPSAVRRINTKSRTQLKDENEEEEDLNALVERILTGPGPAAAPTHHVTIQALSPSTQSSTSSHPPSNSNHQLYQQQHAQVHHRVSGHPQSPTAPPPSTSLASSPPHYQLPQSYSQHEQQQSQRVSLSGSNGAASRHTDGATRADTSLSRVSVGRNGRLFNNAKSASPMDAVVRRLTLWQERREAKRVQSVYEALEKEQEECTFEPSINRLESRDGSRSVSRGRMNSDKAQEETEEESRERSQRVPPGVRGQSENNALKSTHYPLCHNYYNHTSNRSIRSSTSASPTYGGAADVVPSLLPPTQPIYGVEVFVNRLRKAQEERNAAKAAEEAKRLHYYDPTTFKRDVTVPEPFEFGDTRPRRTASSTVPVPGVPSPLARLRTVSPPTEVGTRGTAGTAATWTCSPSRGTLAPSAGVSNVVLNRPPCSHTPGPGSPPANEAGECCHEDSVEMQYVGREEDERMTAENTFLSLAPQIRELFLFDRGMEEQLHRATESIRRGIS